MIPFKYNFSVPIGNETCVVHSLQEGSMFLEQVEVEGVHVTGYPDYLGFLFPIFSKPL